jgi:hypothetical protein
MMRGNMRALQESRLPLVFAYPCTASPILHGDIRRAKEDLIPPCTSPFRESHV